MSACLAQFDSLLARRRFARNAAPVARSSSHQLRDPWGEPVATFSRFPSDAELLKAAHRLQSDDWLGVLADESQTQGLRTAWRLALLRADRHGRARVSREVGPQWLSPVVTERPGARPSELRRALCATAVAQLWQTGWKLVG
ncbi:hypothetical protein [Roseateles amylovorans]|uniref:Uncharacterized protein n=1 Tax=Roseateles amylovorans TaxID=2978473 RepID=A0ABY6AW20_9BURK|nr:hypothetical protein [Roseateles amylovorans]UXH77005.1 hypothetical protein N4261_18525 [Roseateles amylovorans]